MDTRKVSISLASVSIDLLLATIGKENCELGVVTE